MYSRYPARTPEETNRFSGVLLHMRILAHTRMGRPTCVYLYGTPIRVWDNILSHISILFACFISLQDFGYCMSMLL